MLISKIDARVVEDRQGGDAWAAVIRPHKATNDNSRLYGVERRRVR